MGDTGKRADEIIEETMKEIYDDLNSSDAFKETDDDYEDSQEEEINMEDDDSADVSDADDILETDGFDELDEEGSLEEYDDIEDEELEYDGGDRGRQHYRSPGTDLCGICHILQQPFHVLYEDQWDGLLSEKRKPGGGLYEAAGGGLCLNA